MLVLCVSQGYIYIYIYFILTYIYILRYLFFLHLSNVLEHKISQDNILSKDTTSPNNGGAKPWSPLIQGGWRSLKFK